jgi:ligand-binding SRPBCC domain-containing protein
MFGKSYILERRQWIPAAINEVFSFFEKPENLALITPQWLNFRIRTPLPILMEQGTEIEYTIDWLGIPIRWHTCITHYEPPYQFVDTQIAGPYREWIHLHVFEQHDRGVMMTDRVTYRLPLGLPGRAVHRLLVRKQLDWIFNYRKAEIHSIFKTNTVLSKET